MALSQIAPDDLVDQDGRVPMMRYVTLMRTAKALCGEPALALQFSEATRFEAFSVVGLVCQAAGTMGQALEQLNRYRRLIAEVDVTGVDARFQVVRRDDGLWLQDRRPDPDAFPELTEAAFARFACEFSRSHGDAPFLREVHMTHPRPAHAAEYDRIFKAPVTFSAGWNALRIDPAWLSIPTTRPNQYVFGVFNDRAEALLRSLQEASSARGQVEAALIPLLHRGAAGMAATAARLGLSRPTLYRRLRAEGVSFEQVLDELRAGMAKAYLASGRLSVNETAYLLGFSEPSAFSRAFKRWTGKSPRDWAT